MSWHAKLGGQFVVLRDGRDLGLPPNRTVGVLLVGLLSAAATWTSRGQLALRLYGDRTARISLRQAIRRLRTWLGEEAVEFEGDCVRLSGQWTYDLNLKSGEPAAAAMIAPILEHDWLDEIRRTWRPTRAIDDDAVASFDQMVRKAANEDRNQARTILVGGRSLLWRMHSDNAAELLALVRPGKWTEPGVYAYLEVRGAFELRICALATSAGTYQRAYRAARLSQQCLDAERIASWALYSLLESGDVAAASQWGGRIGHGSGQHLSLANALAVEAWNRNKQDVALSIMRSAQRDLGGADRTQRLHFWSNYAVLAAESGDVVESEDAEGYCHAEKLGVFDTRWCEVLEYAHALRLIRTREADEAARTMGQFSAAARRQGWRLSALYAEELIASAKATVGDGTGAMAAWSRANVLRGGNGALNPRRRAIYQRVRVA